MQTTNFKILIYKKLTIILLIILFTQVSVKAQSQFTGLEHLFTYPKTYVTCFTSESPVIDGDITDAVWQNAGWTDFFTDIEGDKKPAPVQNTRVKMLWDKSYLYIAAEIQESHVWAKLLHRDEVIYYDNDFEIFIDPDNNTHQYFEIEVNALNTIFDLFLTKPYRNNGGVLNSWNAPGLRSAVKIQGTLNKPTDTDKRWTVEMAIPYKALTLGNDVNIPKEGDLWRINFSRVQWDTEIKNGIYTKKRDLKGKNLPEHNWVWSPQGIINMHYPERWGYIQFTMKNKEENPSSLQLSYSEKQKKYLWLVYYRQKEFRGKNGSYASSLSQLGIDPEVTIENRLNTLKLEATRYQFRATINVSEDNLISINHEGFVQ